MTRGPAQPSPLSFVPRSYPTDGDDAPTYRFLVLNSMGGGIVTEAEISGVSYGNGLGAIGNFQGTVSLSDPRVNPVNFQGLSREIAVLRNGVPVFCGPITGLNPSKSGNTLQITCSSPFWWLTNASTEIVNHNKLTYYGAVGWAMSVAQGKPGFDRRILKGWDPSLETGTGPIVPDPVKVTYNSTPVATRIATWANVYPGFDYCMTYNYDTNGIITRSLCIYPGLKGNLVGYPLTDENTSDFSYTEDDTRVVTRAIEENQGAADDDTSTLIVSAVNDSTPGSGVSNPVGGIKFPHVEAVNSRDTDSKDTLTLYAKADLFFGTWPSRTYTASFRPTLSLPFDAISPGDSVQVDLSIGNFPVQAVLRCVSLDVTLDDSGEETVAVTFNDPAGQSA